MASPDQVEIPPPSLDDVLYEKREGYALITLNRPVVLNALNWSIMRRLKWALERAESDEDMKAIVLTGAGRAFSAGGDIQSTPPTDGLPSPTGVEINLKIWRMAKPVIAAVRGYAVGQGHHLAGMCDITIAADDAVFGELQIRHGFGPPILISPYLVGLKQAKELLMLGERVSAQEALRLGLVNRVVPGEELLGVAEEMAKKLAALPEKTVRLNKALVNRAYELAGFRESLDYRADPALAELTGAAGAPDPHLAVLREQGWEAFRRSRDAVYGETEAKGPGPQPPTPSPDFAGGGSNDVAHDARAILNEILKVVAGVEAHVSQFAELPAWWVDGREFAHIKADGWLDVRMTRSAIREQRPWLRADERFRLRKPGSDWVEVDVSGGIDDEVGGLLRAAAEANRPANLDRAPDPARVVARGRKLHR